MLRDFDKSRYLNFTINDTRIQCTLLNHITKVLFISKCKTFETINSFQRGQAHINYSWRRTKIKLASTKQGEKRGKPSAHATEGNIKIGKKKHRYKHIRNGSVNNTRSTRTVIMSTEQYVSIRNKIIQVSTTCSYHVTGKVQ